MTVVEAPAVGGTALARTALGRYGVNLNQAVAALNRGAGSPVWLLQAVGGCVRASERMDQAIVTPARRLG